MRTRAARYERTAAERAWTSGPAGLRGVRWQRVRFGRRLFDKGNDLGFTPTHAVEHAVNRKPHVVGTRFRYPRQEPCGAKRKGQEPESSRPMQGARRLRAPPQAEGIVGGSRSEDDDRQVAGIQGIGEVREAIMDAPIADRPFPRLREPQRQQEIAEAQGDGSIGEMA